ncbi:hypothetical protein Ccrd_007833, partial [Cynara cardunculus var. scolymus]
WAGPSGSVRIAKPLLCTQDCEPIFKLLIVVLHYSFIYQFEESDRKIIMAGRLSHAASQIMGGNGIVGRSVASSLRLRSGMGLPVGKHIVPDRPLPVNDELVWDNGTPFPEPCIDRIAETVGKHLAGYVVDWDFLLLLDCWLPGTTKRLRYHLPLRYFRTTTFEWSLVENPRMIIRYVNLCICLLHLGFELVKE